MAVNVAAILLCHVIYITNSLNIIQL